MVASRCVLVPKAANGQLTGRRLGSPHFEGVVTRGGEDESAVGRGDGCVHPEVMSTKDLLASASAYSPESGRPIRRASQYTAWHGEDCRAHIVCMALEHSDGLAGANAPETCRAIC